MFIEVIPIIKNAGKTEMQLVIKFLFVLPLSIIFVSACSSAGDSSSSSGDADDVNISASSVYDDTTTTIHSYTSFDRYRCATKKITTSSTVSFYLKISIYTSANTKKSRICEAGGGNSTCYDGYTKKTGTDGLGNYTLYQLDSTREEDIYIYDSGDVARLELLSSSLCFRYYE